MQEKIKIYSTPSCPVCTVLKMFLKEHNIDFQDIDVSKDEKVKGEIIKKSGKIEVPMIEIDDKIVVGFDRKEICRLLNIKE